MTANHLWLIGRQLGFSPSRPSSGRGFAVARPRPSRRAFRTCWEMGRSRATRLHVAPRSRLVVMTCTGRSTPIIATGTAIRMTAKPRIRRRRIRDSNRRPVSAHAVSIEQRSSLCRRAPAKRPPKCQRHSNGSGRPLRCSPHGPRLRSIQPLPFRRTVPTRRVRVVGRFCAPIACCASNRHSAVDHV